MTEPLSAHRAKIEQAVQSRQTVIAKREIRAYLGRLNKTARKKELFVLCDWYRRLGLYEEGFRLLELKNQKQRLQAKAESGTYEGMRLLWAARFLNLLGAWEHALLLLSAIRITDLEGIRLAGNIFLT